MTPNAGPHQEPLQRGARHLIHAGLSRGSRLREIRAAIAAFSEFLKKNPGDRKALHGRALAYAEKSRLQGAEGGVALRCAESDFSEMIAADPAVAAGWQGRGIARFLHASQCARSGEERQRLLNEAIADCSRALEIDPCDFESLSQRGLAWASLAGTFPAFDADIWRRSRDDYAAAARLAPDRHDILSGLSMAQLALALPRDPDISADIAGLEAAIANVSRARALAPARPDLGRRLAQALVHLGAARALAGADPIHDWRRALELLAARPLDDAEAASTLSMLVACLQQAPPAVAATAACAELLKSALEEARRREPRSE